MNKKTIFLLSFLILSILTSCTDSTEKAISIETNFNNWYNNNTKQNTKIYSPNAVVINDEINQTLTIDDRCIWCWKCAIIAPQNFAMDYNTLKAVVINQKWMFSSEVSKSIQVCPVDSIHIW